MKKKSKHKRKIEILNKLVMFTDFYVSHVWNEQGASFYGFVNSIGKQKFKRDSKHWKEFFTPYLPCSFRGKIFFAVMPRTKLVFGTVLQGWKELKWFIAKELVNKELHEKHQGLM